MLATLEPASPKLLRLNAVLALIGVKRSTLYAWIHAGTFPQQRKLGVRAVAWLESEVIAWINTKGGHA